MLILVGIIFVVAGLIFKILPPKKINHIYGYRSILSMKNQETWDEGQKYSANTIIILGFIDAVLGFALSQLIGNINQGYEGAILIIGAVLMIILDELHLKKIFNKDGSRKL